MRHAPAAALVAALAAVLLALVPSAAHAAVTIAPPSGDVVEDVATTLTITGSAPGARTVRAGSYADRTTCPAARDSEANVLDVLPGSSVQAGAWTRTVELRAPSAGSHLVCVWVIDSNPSSAEEIASRTVTARAPRATIDFTVSADPMAERQHTITARGTSEAVRELHVASLPGDVPCPATPPYDERDKVVSGFDVGPGTFETSGSWRSNTPGTHTICGWVQHSFEPGLNGSARMTYTLRAPGAAVTIAGPTTLTTREGGRFSAQGTAEVARGLWAVVHGGAGCAPTVRQQEGTWVTHTSVTVGPGQFAHPITVPKVTGRFTLCVYVGRETASDAVAQVAYTMGLDAKDDPSQNRTIPERPDVPKVALTGPGDGLRSTSMRPTFAWNGTGGLADDTLILANGDREALVKLEGDRATVYHGNRQLKAETAELAEVRVSAAGTTMRLRQPLPPGDYVWWVVREGRNGGAGSFSGERRLTIVGPKLGGRLAKKVYREPDRWWTNPGSSYIAVGTAPYAKVRFVVRRGGRTKTTFTAADSKGSAGHIVWWSCRQPGGRNRVSIRVSDQYGASRSTTVTVRGPSRARCRKLYRDQLAWLERNGTPDQSAQKRAAAAALKKFKAKCTKLGGVPVEIKDPLGDYTDCRNPAGGYVVVRI